MINMNISYILSDNTLIFRKCWTIPLFQSEILSQKQKWELRMNPKNSSEFSLDITQFFYNKRFCNFKSKVN